MAKKKHAVAKQKQSAAQKKKRCGLETKKPRRMRIFICLAVFTTICFLALAVPVIRHNIDLAASRQELAALPALPKTPSLVWSDLNTYDKKMREINPDYVGVIQVEATPISYPVVRGEDNVKYLNTTFNGIENLFGGLFMDYRCVEENAPHIIIYGHHAQGSSGNRIFFGALDVFLDEQYRAEHTVVSLIEK